MNNCFRMICGILVCMLMGRVCAMNLPINNKDSIVYVWDFSVSDSSIEEIGTMLTNDFETELINSGLYTVLERRRYQRVLAHQNLAKKIADVQNMPAAARDTLKANRAGVVIFGEVKDDIDSGVYEVTVTFQKLNEVILRKGSILIGRGLIRDNQTRKQFMKDLVDVVHAKELLAAKKEQYNSISNLLETYIIRVRDVRKEFHDVTKYALEDRNYLNEIIDIVGNYNASFNELNNHGAKYQTDFSKHWGVVRGQELQAIIDNILDDIHKTYILKLDKVRLAISDYRQSELSKKEKKKRKAEILKDVKNTTDDLKTQIDIIDLKINTFLSQLRIEMNG